MNWTWITCYFLLSHLILQFSSSPSPATIPSSSPQHLTAVDSSPIGDSRFHPLVKRHPSPSPAPHPIYQPQKSLLPRASIDSDFQNNSLAAGAGTIQEAHEELFKVVPEVRNVYLAIALIPAFIVIFGSFSAFVKEKLYIGESIISVVFGIILGPYVSGVFDPRSWGQGRNFDQLTLEITRIVVALSVFAVGVELPKAYILRHWRSLALLIGPAMLFGWIVSGALIYALVPALSFLQALVVAAAVTPTDPVLAASVVGRGKYAQKHVPAHLRHLLQAESGGNDGAAFPFLYLAMFLVLREDTSIGLVIGKWLLLIILYQILLGIVMGAVVGILARKTLKFCKRRSMIDKESMVAMYVALALLTTGVTALAGSDDLLAAFSCGAAFAWDDWFTESIEASNFSSILDLLINCATFIYIGATIPFSSWSDSTLTLVPWRLVVLGFSILLLRRLPILILMQKFVPDFKTHREAVFCGHFGPIGVGAIFISTLATTKLPTPQVPPQTSLDILALTTQSLIYLLVFFSILIHGLSIPFFTLGRNVHSRVHTMTRTWTQASGNEPSWLSRVKRVEKPSENSAEVLNNESDNVNDLNPIDPQNLSTPMDSSQRQISDDQITQVDGQNQKEAAWTTPASQPGPSDGLLPISSQITNPVTNERVLLKSTPSSGLLRLGSRTKRTPEEQAARQREKLLRDAWCRPERIDVLKKDEERVYKSGRRLVIERGDGDIVEVQDLPPLSFKKSPRIPLDSQSSPASEANGSPNPQSHSSQTRKFDFAKLIVPRSISKQKVSQVQDSTSVLPVPPRAQSDNGQQLNPDFLMPSNESRSVPGSMLQPAATRSDEAVWIEGDKFVIERNDGEDVQVESRNQKEMRSSRSPPMITRSPSPDSLKSVSKASVSIPTRDVNPKSDDQAVAEHTSTKPEEPDSQSNQDDDDWEEEKDSSAFEDDHEESKFHDSDFARARPSISQRRYSSHQSRRPRRKISGRLSGVPSGSVNSGLESGHPRKSMDSVLGSLPSRGVEFVNSEKHKSRVARRSKSPSSRSTIRFAAYPERPLKASQLDYKKLLTSKHHHRKNSDGSSKSNKTSRLKDFVSPAVDSWRRSSLTGTPNSITESSQKGDYFSTGGLDIEIPSQTADASSSVVDDHSSNSKKD